MSTRKRDATRRRQAVLDALLHAGREHSDATVIFHATVADRLGLHPTDSKAMSLLRTASVTALVDRLERRGLARRRPDPTDRRRVMVEATREGIGEFVPFFESSRRSLGRLFEPYTTKELEVILDFLMRSAVRLRAETQRLPQLETAAAKR